MKRDTMGVREGVRGPLSSSPRFLLSRPVVRAGDGVALKGASTHPTSEWQLVVRTIFLASVPSPFPLSLLQSNKVPVVQHPHHMHPLTPLITYSNDHFSPASPPTHLSPEIDPKTGEWPLLQAVLPKGGRFFYRVGVQNLDE